MINKVEINDNQIYLNIWGQVFYTPLVNPPLGTEKEQMIKLGTRLMEMGGMIQKQAFYGKPIIAIQPNGVPIISIGFDEKGNLIIPEINNG